MPSIHPSIIHYFQVREILRVRQAAAKPRVLPLEGPEHRTFRDPDTEPVIEDIDLWDLGAREAAPAVHKVVDEAEAQLEPDSPNEDELEAVSFRNGLVDAPIG